MMNNEAALLMNNESLWYFLTKMIPNKSRQGHHNYSLFISKAASLFIIHYGPAALKQQGPFSFDLVQQLFHQGGIGPVVELSVEADVGTLAAQAHAGHQFYLQLATRTVEKMR